MYELGKLYLEESEDEALAQQGLKLVSKASDQGLVFASITMANVYLGLIKYRCKNLKINKNYDLAYKYACKAYDKKPNNWRTQELLAGIIYRYAGKQGIPCDENKAYSLLEQVAHVQSLVNPLDYVFLGNTCYKKNEYEKARFWFEKAGNLKIAQFFLAVIDLIMQDRGSCFDRQACYDAIESELFDTFDCSDDEFIHYNQEVENDVLVDALKKHSETDDRARFILARLACTGKQENFFGINQVTSFEYMQEKALEGNANARQALGAFYGSGVYVPQSYETAVEHLIPIVSDCSAQPHIRGMTIKNLVKIATQASGKPAIVAALTVVSTLIKQNDACNKDLIYALIDKAEAEVLGLKSSDEKLNSLFFTSGIFEAACHYAKTIDTQLAFLLGYSLALRFTHKLCDFETLFPQGFDLLEYFYAKEKTKENGRKLAQLYTRVAQYCMINHPDRHQDIKKILGRAMEIDPDYGDAEQALIDFYHAGFDTTISREASSKKAIALQEKLAESGNEYAMIEMALIYISEFKSKNSDGRHVPKCVNYLKTLAEKGNYYALFLLSSGAFNFRVRKLASTLQGAVKTMIANLPCNDPLKTDKLFQKALQSMINQNWSLACTLFEQLSEKYHKPHLLLISANIQFVVLKNHKLALGQALKAMADAKSQGKNLDDISSHFMLHNIYTVLQYDARTNPDFKTYLETLKMVFENLGYPSMGVLAE